MCTMFMVRTIIHFEIAEAHMKAEWKLRSEIIAAQK